MPLEPCLFRIMIAILQCSCIRNNVQRQPPKNQCIIDTSHSTHSVVWFICLMMTYLACGIATVDCHSCVPSATVTLVAIVFPILHSSSAFGDLDQGLPHVGA